LNSEYAALALSGVSVSFEDSGVEILSSSTVAFAYGLSYITARNGAGKSTLLRALAGFDNLRVAGHVQFEGMSLRPENVGLVTQDPMASICRDLTFRDNLLLARLHGRQWLSLRPLSGQTAWKEAERNLTQLGIMESTEELWDRQAKHLSGGEQQLLAILMRLGRGKRLLLLDECTASLDRNNTQKVMSMLAKLREVRCVALLVTHDVELIDEYQSPVFTIRDRQLTLKHNGDRHVETVSATPSGSLG
jgi:ABC-type Mn2+/Zn2+ transport system ATPase subunit